jgi:hypothetical protein
VSQMFPNGRFVCAETGLDAFPTVDFCSWCGRHPSSLRDLGGGFQLTGLPNEMEWQGLSSTERLVDVTSFCGLICCRLWALRGWHGRTGDCLYTT